MVFKANGPGGCCCDPCEGISGVTSYVENFASGTGTWDHPVSWPPTGITNVGGRLRHSNNNFTHYPAYKHMRCSSVDSFTRTVELDTYLTIPSPPPVGSQNAIVGPTLYGTDVNDFTARFHRTLNVPFATSGDRYRISWGTSGAGTGETFLTTIPVNGDTLKIEEVTNDYDAGDFTVTWYLNGTSVYSLNSITDSKDFFGNFDDPPCRTRAGFTIGGANQIIEIDNFSATVSCA